jgi:hypothetical protein
MNQDSYNFILALMKSLSGVRKPLRPRSEPTPLEGIFTDLYILDKPLAMRRFNRDDLLASDEKLYGHNIKHEEGIAVVK